MRQSIFYDSYRVFSNLQLTSRNVSKSRFIMPALPYSVARVYFYEQENVRGKPISSDFPVTSLSNNAEHGRCVIIAD